MLPAGVAALLRAGRAAGRRGAFKTCGGGPYSCHACGGQPLRRRVGECFNATWTQDPQFWKLLGCSGGQVQLGIYNVSDTTCTGGHKVAVQPLQQCVSLEPTRDSWEWLQCGES